MENVTDYKNKNIWQFDLYHRSNVTGDYWSFEFTELSTGKKIGDCTAEDCTREQAKECAYRFFTNQTGLIYKSITGA